MGLFSRKNSGDPPVEPPDNLEIRTALEKLSRTPSVVSRRALYRVLTQGCLRVAVKELPSGNEGGPHVLKEGVQVQILTSKDAGGALVILAFTDAAQMQKRSPGSPWISISSRSLLEHVVAQGYGGLVLDPEGPWALISSEDIRTLLLESGE